MLAIDQDLLHGSRQPGQAPLEDFVLHQAGRIGYRVDRGAGLAGGGVDLVTRDLAWLS